MKLPKRIRRRVLKDAISSPECGMCKLACLNQTYKLTHKMAGEGEESNIVFCSWECMMDYFEMRERVEEEIHKRVEKETKELQRRVCPACVRRFHELK